MSVPHGTTAASHRATPAASTPVATTSVATPPVVTTPHPAPHTGRRRRGHLGRLVAGSLATGAALSAVLTLLVFPGADEAVITGAALTSWAIGWGLLWWLSAHRTQQPQQWALVPAAAMGVTGLVYLLAHPDAGSLSTWGWVWPAILAALVVWMVRQSRRSLHSWARPVLLYPVFAVLALCAVGGTYEKIAETGDAGNLAAPGHRFDVGGHQLFLRCAGTGKPTVVLEAGLGSSSSVMSGWIAPQVAEATRVCVYDRAGYGRSEPSPSPRDGLQAAADLHTVLAAAHEHGPYVLAGHSSGAVYVGDFANAYPDQVAGMVLLDGQSPDVMAKLPGWSTFYAVYRRVEALAPSLARVGVARLLSRVQVAGLPEPARTQERTSLSTPRYYRALRDELAHLPTALHQAQPRRGGLGNKPLVVVTAGRGAQRGWMPLQDGMTRLSTNSLHVVLPTAAHADLTGEEAAAHASAAAVTRAVTAVRTGEPLLTAAR
jgi:pimeloyl-ACP methyl ester carboxylesterase